MESNAAVEIDLLDDCPECEEEKLIRVRYPGRKVEWCINCTYEKVEMPDEEGEG